MPTVTIVLDQLKALGNEEHKASKVRLGIPAESSLGVSLPDIRALAKQIKRDHALAIGLWQSGYHEARLLAVLIADPKQVDDRLIEQWVGDVVSWDLSDHLCNNLFRKLPQCVAKIPVWAADEREFVRRTAFSLIANLATHHPAVLAAHGDAYLQLIRQYASDGRNFVRKAVSWALREIGQHDVDWQARALIVARELAESGDKNVRWVGNDALKELEKLTPVAGRKRLVAAAQ